MPVRRRVDLGRKGASLTLTHAALHNLRDLTVEIPLGRLVCITGVSGSGKSTLVREVLYPLLSQRLGELEKADREGDADEAGREEETDAAGMPGATLTGEESLGRVLLVDQSPIGKTPRSTPAVFIGAFDEVRSLFAQTEMARQRGLSASAFSFNSAQGQCERCRGAGFEKIEMQFLSDVFIRCQDCDGRRYRSHILEVTLDPPEDNPRAATQVRRRRPRSGRAQVREDRGWNIADFLEATVDVALEFLAARAESAPARRAQAALRLLHDVGLGYLRLGQPINTLSGGESQRLKLVGHLARFANRSGDRLKPALFIFDEPTTGLHFDDVRVLLDVFQRLVGDGHSLLVVEHNLDVIKTADWVIDLGPEAGDEGGRIVAQGTPEQIARCRSSRTGEALREPLRVAGQKALRGTVSD